MGSVGCLHSIQGIPSALPGLVYSDSDLDVRLNHIAEPHADSDGSLWYLTDHLRPCCLRSPFYRERMRRETIG